MAKFKAGDEVTVRATILKVEIDSLAVGITSEDGEATHYTHGVPFGEIATHTPKTREFKPGDMVYADRDHAKYELVGIRGMTALLWFEKQDFGRACKVSDLRHADEAD